MDEAKKAERARELEEKKARLEAYRVKRRLDKLPDAKGEDAPSAAASSSSSSPAPPSAPSVEALLASVLAEQPVPAASPAPPENSVAVAASVAAAEVSLAVRRGAASTEAAPREVETYVRSTQTDLSAPHEQGDELSEGPAAAAAPVETAEEAEARRAREEEAKEAAARAAAEAEKHRQGEERKRLQGDAGVALVAERAGELAERVLRASENTRDPLRDPRKAAAGAGTAGGADGAAAGVGERVIVLGGEGPVVGVAGSPHAPELALAVHGGGEAGRVALWGLDGLISDRPLREFAAESRLTRAVFVPWSPHLLLGASYSGSLLLWDQRGRSAAPVLESGAGHSHPVVSLACLGSSHAQLVHSVSSDGRQCSWSLAQLSSPASTSELRAGGAATAVPLVAVAPSCAAFGPHETDAFALGTEEGRLFLTSRSASSDDDLSARPSLAAHRGPVRSLSFGPSSGQGGALLASCGADWRVRVWDAAAASSGGKQLSLDVPARCCATAVAWGRPGALFAADARGEVHTWDLARNLRRPTGSSESVRTPLLSLGLHHALLLAGDSAGAVHVFRPHETLLPGSAHDEASAQAVAAALDSHHE